jgi:uncharacterized protein YndB with AHSA1/START domain
MHQSEPIIIERVYNASVTETWQALTDPAKMKKWYFDIPDFKAEDGFTFTFNAGPQGKEFKHSCTITEVEPEEKLSYSWSSDYSTTYS